MLGSLRSKDLEVVDIAGAGIFRIKAKKKEGHNRGYSLSTE